MSGAVAPPRRPGTALADQLHVLLRDIVGPADCRLVVVSMSKDENPKATVLAFVGADRHPSLVVKVARTEGASASVRREAVALHRLATLDPALLGHTVPRLVDTRSVDGRAVLVTTACAGQPMSIPYHRWHHTASPALVGADFAVAATWLRQLSALVTPDQSGSAWPTGSSTDGVLELPDRISRRWPGDPLAAEVTEWAEGRGRMLRVDRSGVVHGDFWCGNVLRAADRVSGVVDWEHAGWGDPLRDRVRFALSYALYLDRHTPAGARVTGHRALVAGRWGDPIRYAVLGDTWFPSLVADFVGDGLVATGRSRGLWRDALVLGLVEIAATSDHAEFARRHLDLAAELGPWT